MKLAADARQLSYLLIVGIGLISNIGYIFNAEKVRGLGQLTVASPLPLVFSAFRGIETFALKFVVQVRSQDGTESKVEITPAVYSRFHAPYNLRNVYGAALSYGPGFQTPQELKVLDTILKHGFCNRGSLALHFGITQPVSLITIRATSKTANSPGEWELKADCNQGVQQ